MNSNNSPAWLAMLIGEVSFATAEKGDIESLAVKLEPTVKAQVFTRIPDPPTK